MQLAPGWTLNVDRGPDWIFVRLHCNEPLLDEAADLAEQLWDLLRCHFSHRMVVELDEVPRLSARLIDQLVLLGRRIHEAGGILRLCGVSPSGQVTIEAARLDRVLPCYASRTAAVMGHRPRQPR